MSGGGGHSSYLIGCWAADDIRFLERRKNDAKDPGRPFPSVRHYVGDIMLILNNAFVQC